MRFPVCHKDFRSLSDRDKTEQSVRELVISFRWSRAKISTVSWNDHWKVLAWNTSQGV